MTSSDARELLNALKELHKAASPIVDRADKSFPEALSLNEFERFGNAMCEASALLHFAEGESP